jgi:5-formyltetrahydrofolate cyclo-ligase
MDKSDAKKTLRQALIEQRLNLPDRLDRAETLQRVMRIWLVGRPDTVIGAYWPIKGEFDPLPRPAPLEGRRRVA